MAKNKKNIEQDIELPIKSTNQKFKHVNEKEEKHDWIKCPVCGTRVDASTSKFSQRYQGKRIFFCTDQCLQGFDKSPEKYSSRTEVS